MFVTGAIYGDLPECVGVAPPGRAHSDLSAILCDPSKELDLPNITMVFAIMEGGKAFVKKMRREAEQVRGLGGGRWSAIATGHGSYMF